MIKICTKLQKTAITVVTFLFLSTTITAQKSVYDVVPGSGPKKKTESKTVYDVTKKKTYEKKEGIYYPHRKRKNLPPGQAKKIYGGSATDYAPGQVKKKKGHRKHKKHHHHKD